MYSIMSSTVRILILLSNLDSFFLFLLWLMWLGLAKLYWIIVGWVGILVLSLILPMQETQIQSLGREDPLEEGMATYSNILAWRIPWTKLQSVAGRLQSMGLQRVRHDWATNTKIVSMPIPWRDFFFNHKWVFNFVKVFFLHLLRWSYGFYLSVPLYGISHWFSYAGKSLHFWNKLQMITVWSF